MLANVYTTFPEFLNTYSKLLRILRDILLNIITHALHMSPEVSTGEFPYFVQTANSVNAVKSATRASRAFTLHQINRASDALSFLWTTSSIFTFDQYVSGYVPIKRRMARSAALTRQIYALQQMKRSICPTLARRFRVGPCAPADVSLSTA